MLQFFRSLINSKVGAAFAILILGLIALAFAGGDVIHSGAFGGVAGGDRAATVGRDRIDTSALSQGASNALERMKQQDPRLSMQGFIARGGLDQVLDQMIGRTAVAGFGRQHGIVAGDRLIDSEITQIAAFKGPDGKFSQDAFRQAINQRGMSEKLVRDDIAQGLIARQVLLPAAFNPVVPLEFAKRYAALLKDRRIGAVAVLPSAAFVPAKPPSDAELAAFYTKNRSRFIRPERRAIRYAAFDETALKNVAAPTEAEIAARYKAGQAQYAALESRKVTQLIVPTEGAAKAIMAEVAGGKTLEATAREKGLATAVVGPLSRDALAAQSSPAVATAVFAAAKGAIAAPARGPLGWHVMHVDAVETRAARSLDQVRGEIVAQLTDANRRAKLTEMLTRIEDEFDKGGNLEDAAKELGLTIERTAPLTADGRLYAKPDEKAPDVLARVLQTAFSMEKENEAQIAEVDPGKTFIIFDVTDMEASAPAPLKEIQGDVVSAYMLQKGFEAANAAAVKVQGEVRKGTDLGKAIAALGKPLPPVEQVDMDRVQLTRMQQQVPPPMALFFSMAEGTVKLLPGQGNRGWFVVYLKDIQAGAVADNDPLLAPTRRELGTIASDEYVESLRNAITAEAGVKRNPAAIKAVRDRLGGGS